MTNNQDASDLTRLVIDYLDAKNGTVKLAYEIGVAVNDAADGEKLKIFDTGVQRLRILARELVTDAFAKFIEVADRAGHESPVEWAEQELRAYLEPWLGHQLEYEMEVDCPAIAPYLWHGEFPHKAIVFWVAQAASQEGGQLVLPTDDPLGDLSDAQLLRHLDEQLMRSSYRAPGWLRRIRDCDEPRKQAQLETLSLHETRQEIGFLQTQLWDDIETIIRSEKLRASLEAEVTASKVQPTEPKTAPTQSEYSFIKRGVFWEIRFQGALAHAPNLQGIRYIAYLLQNPNKPVHVNELIRLERSPDQISSYEATLADYGSSEGGKKAGSNLEKTLARQGLSIQQGLGDEDTLDERANEDYRKSAGKLREELEETSDDERREEILEELEQIAKMLKSSSWRGKPKAQRKETDRPRIAVWRNINRAITALRNHNPQLAQYLESHIKTGDTCIYISDAAEKWSF